MNLNQITIPVKNIGDSIDFYRKLGLTLIVDSPENRYARFECPGEAAKTGATLSLHEADTPPRGEASLYFEVADVDARVAELKEAGFRFDAEPVDQQWLWREAWTRDPDSNRIGIYRAGDNRRFPPWRLSGLDKD